MRLLVTVSVAVTALVLTAARFVQDPAVEPEADRILRAMSDYLGASKDISFNTEISFDLAGQPKLEFAATQAIQVRRPDRLRVEYRGDLDDRDIWFDGERLTYLDPLANLYAQMEAGPKIDTALDRMLAKGGFNIPVADFVYADVYESLMQGTVAGAYAGQSTIRGVTCHHLSYRHETLDWQIWIDTGDRPLPRKLVITYRMLDQSPQFSTTFVRWDLEAEHSDEVFAFQVPADATEIELVATQIEEQQ